MGHFYAIPTVDGQVFIAAARTNAGTKTKKGYYEGRILRILQVLPFGSFYQPSFSDDFNTKSGSHSSHLNGRALIPKVSQAKIHVLKNLSREPISQFREQVEVVDLIGELLHTGHVRNSFAIAA
jgi:hypothetical protein